MTPPIVLPIPPGSAPGGFVFRVTTHGGSVLSEEAITEQDGDLAESVAARQGLIAKAHVDRTGWPAVLYVFDGDSGQCVEMLVSSADHR